jgi:hypothetical protein
VLHVLEHLEEERFPLPSGLRTLPRFLQFVPQHVELFAEDVHEDVRGRLRTFVTGCLRAFAVRCPRTSVRCLRLVFCGGIVEVCGRPRTSFEDVYVCRDADKFCLIEQAVRRGTQFALVDEFVEGTAGNAELAGGFGFGERGHGWA